MTFLLKKPLFCLLLSYQGEAKKRPSDWERSDSHASPGALPFHTPAPMKSSVFPQVLRGTRKGLVSKMNSFPNKKKAMCDQVKEVAAWTPVQTVRCALNSMNSPESFSQNSLVSVY